MKVDIHRHVGVKTFYRFPGGSADREKENTFSGIRRYGVAVFFVPFISTKTICKKCEMARRFGRDKSFSIGDISEKTLIGCNYVEVFQKIWKEAFAFPKFDRFQEIVPEPRVNLLLRYI